MARGQARSGEDEGRTHAAREEKGALLVDADGDGSTETTVAAQGAVIDVVSGDKKAPVLVTSPETKSTTHQS